MNYPHYRFKARQALGSIQVSLRLRFEGGKSLSLTYDCSHRIWRAACNVCERISEKPCECPYGPGLARLTAPDLYSEETARYVMDSWLTSSVGLVEAAEVTGEVVEHLRVFDMVSKSILRQRWVSGADPYVISGDHRRLARRASGSRDRARRYRAKVRGL